MAEGHDMAADEEEESFDEHSVRSSGQQHCGFDLNLGCSDWMTLVIASPKRSRRRSGIGDISSDNCESYSSDGACSNEEPQDADYSSIPSLSYELESLIFARFPRSEYWKLCFLNKRSLSLVKSGELYKIRRRIGFSEPSVFMSGAGQSSWWAFDSEFKSCRQLPILPWDNCFANGDKESLSVGTDVLVCGKEMEGLVTWRYELVRNKWYRGPSMITPRCLFASATCGSYAYVAGGMALAPGGVMSSSSSAEKYNPAESGGSWVQLPRMIKKRYLCAGCYMDSKFYVIGGRNEEEGELRCGECYEESENRWALIPDLLLLKDDDDEAVVGSGSCRHSPPLVAVVNNELYWLEASSNQVKVYMKRSKTWKALGRVPVRADSHNGWGVAFKCVGKQLLVIGAEDNNYCMSIYTCRPPDPDPNNNNKSSCDRGVLQWRRLALDNNISAGNCVSNFILNCCVMEA